MHSEVGRASRSIRVYPTLAPFQGQPHAHDPQGVQRLALSESPYGASAAAEAAIVAEATRVHLYPHSDAEPVRSALARHYGVAPDEVLVANGADELILMAALAIAVPGRHGVITDNSFAGYAASLEAADQAFVKVPLRDGATDADQVAAAMEGAGCVMVCNPHNPTGSALSADSIAMLADAARAAGAILVLDEAYAEFADPEVFGSGLPHLAGGSVVVLRTFSKAYGLAGARVGYALGDREVVGAMRALRHALPYNTSRFALAAAGAALQDQDHVVRVVAMNRNARLALTAGLNERGLTTLPSQTNFVLTWLGPNGVGVIERLARDHAVHIRDVSGMGFPNWARISVPRGRDVAALVTVISQAGAAADGAEIGRNDK